MNDLVEKIAKALWHDRWEGYGRSWELESDKEQDDYRGAARAVLAAIEESQTHVVVPVELTDQMTTAGAMTEGQPTPMAFTRAWWAAMLSARPPITGEQE